MSTEKQQPQLKETKGLSKSTLFIGTYTKKEGHVNGKAAGVYVYTMEEQSGQLEPKDTITGVVNPSYLALHPNGKYLYVVNELADNTDAIVGKITAFSIDVENGNYRLLNTVSAKGDAPCYISVSPDGKFVLVANYVSGNVASFPIKKDGGLGEAVSVQQHERKEAQAPRQEAAHAHMIEAGRNGEAIFAVDLGTDEIIHYQLDEDGKLTKLATTRVAKGAGPRHLAFHPMQPWCYVLNELNTTIEAFSYTQPNVSMKQFQVMSTLEKQNAETFGTVNTAAIKIHPSGKFLYASNRGIQENAEQSIAMFSIEQTTGKLTHLGNQAVDGEIPRDFEIDPNGQFLLVANQNSDTVITYKIDSKTGRLEDIGKMIEVLTPVCLKFVR